MIDMHGPEEVFVHVPHIPPPPISKARPMPVGPWSDPAMMMADIPAGPPTARTYSNCWRTSAPARLTSLSFTRSTA
jgi:hypothetical protein